MPGRAEFEDFYAASAARVLGQLYVMTGNRAEAEDAVAEAFARAWQRWSSVSAADSPEAWVRRVASRIAISGWRKAVTRMRAHQRDATDRRIDGLSLDHVALMQALRNIPAAQRRDIVLHHLVGLSVDDVAAETGSPTGSVKARLARGRRTLATLLADQDPRSVSRESAA